jgi:predicted nuclease of predicted toxin-antitoxin system
VKLLLNMNVVPQLGAHLGAMGHTWRHVREIGLERAEDPAIVDAARTGAHFAHRDHSFRHGDQRLRHRDHAMGRVALGSAVDG